VHNTYTAGTFQSIKTTLGAANASKLSALVDKLVGMNVPTSKRILIYDALAQITSQQDLVKFLDDFEAISVFRRDIIANPSLIASVKHLPNDLKTNIKWLERAKSWFDEGVTFTVTSTQSVLQKGNTTIAEIRNGKLFPILYDNWRSPSDHNIGDVIDGYQLIKVGNEIKVKRVADVTPYSPTELGELTAHPDAHVLERHGHDVTDEALIKRANTNPAIAPDGSTSGPPPYSSKFESPAKLKEALAQTRPGTPAFSAKTPNRFLNGYDVNYELTDGTFFGYGIARNTTSRTYFKKVLASYSEVSPGNFQLVTMYLIP
jgi:hypothetical protein